jgi:hypothetical protein
MKLIIGQERLLGTPAPTTLAYPIEAIPLVAGVTRTQIFQAIKNKELMARKRGRRTIIEVDELRRWISTFPTKGRVPDVCDAERLS